MDSDPNAAPGGTGEGQNQEKPDQQEFITLDQAQKIANEAEEKAFKRAQGLITKTTGKVRGRLEALEQQWKMQEEAGKPVPPEVKERMTNKVIAEEYTGGESPPQDAI